MLQSHVPQQSHAQQHQPQMGAFHFSAFNAAAQVPQMDALEMQLASMQGMPGYGEARSTPPAESPLPFRTVLAVLLIQKRAIDECGALCRLV